MWITGSVIATGALYTGVNKYKAVKKRKETPWTYRAEQLAKKNKRRQSLSLRKNKRLPSEAPTTLTSVVMAGQAAYERFKPKQILPFFEDARQKQLQEISATSEMVEISEAEKEADRKIALSLASVGLITAGHFIYPPLTLVSLPAIFYLTGSRVKAAYKALFEERRLRIIVADALWSIGGLMSGYYFWVALGSGVYHLSEKLLAKTEDSSRKSLVNVFGEQPRFVWVLANGTEVEIPFENLQAEDVVVVGAGQVIPVDGTIVDGMASIDQQRLTGEAQPAEKGIGEQVFAATIVLSGKVYIEVEKTGQQTAAAQIGEILNQTANFKLSIQSRGATLTDQSTLPTLILSTIALPLVGPSGALALLGNYPGANLRLLAPMTLLNFLQMASQAGILIKDGRSLEVMGEVDTIIFDKTGTLTLETPHVGEIHLCQGVSRDELLTYAATAEHKQPHPIARAILNAARERNLPLHDIQDAHYEIGYGIKVHLDDKLIRVGSDRFMGTCGIAIPPEIEERHAYCRTQGYSLVMVAVNEQLAGAIELHATIRPETKEIVSQLRERNFSLYIISGDQEEPTKKLAHSLGIDHYFANTLPENKAQLVEQLQQEGKTVCFVGDGINDSIALRCADVSISLCGASTIATDTAQIVLMDPNLHRLIDLLDITHQLDANMKSNTITSIIPGLVGIGGVFFFHLGFVSSLVLYTLGLFSGIGNTMRPMLRQHLNSNQMKAR